MLRPSTQRSRTDNLCPVAKPGTTYTPAMEIERVEDLVWELGAGEFPGALRLLAAMERAGWVSPQEAEEWRGQTAALGVCQQNSQLWINGQEA